MNKNFLQNAEFIGSFPSLDKLPEDQGSEIAFCGRSNSGKSSVLNALTNNKKLAKTSKTPGRTQAVNIFKIIDSLEYKIIDLPGYGYAKVSKKLRADWGVNIDNYLNTRQCLKGLVLIMDIRHPFKDEDLTLIDWCERKNLPFILLLNKSDKLSNNKALQVLAMSNERISHLYTKNSILVTSAKTKNGIKELIKSINSLLV
ncbi:MAG: YihA family ribosome biogenesis GTP-binding protein [Gammaproteobacteria bacterium]|nr:YihA family ribosome biogenesis GTP-binding protein [Gammaproteobacteria bacterium]HJM59376.1 ribosome biogenesis GTP-binding protein YihA/YsxC [SAR86 cluster bacterium]